ncbi:MAG TPA: hypothetical protein VEI02_11145 [Planctomycetota bacterium]|nr:hypothetical protein [Planctomycetota bacterium]
MSPALRLVFGVVFLAGSAPAQASRPARAPSPTPERPAAASGWWDDVFVDRAATLTDVLAAPESFRGAIFRADVQFRRTVKPPEAYHTKFDGARWLCFAAWPDEASLWDARAFEADHPYFFVRRDAPEAGVLAEAQVYARFTARARIVETLKGRPWIEVLSLEPLPGRLTEACLIRMVKGLRLRDLRKFEAAADEFAAADDAALPGRIRVAALRERAECLRTSGRLRAAVDVLETALRLAPDDAALGALLVETRAVMRRDVDDARSDDAPASRPAPPAVDRRAARRDDRDP